MPWSPDNITIGEFEDLPVQQLPRRNGWFTPDLQPANQPPTIDLAAAHLPNDPTPVAVAPPITLAPVAEMPTPAVDTCEPSHPTHAPTTFHQYHDEDLTLDWSRLVQISQPVPATLPLSVADDLTVAALRTVCGRETANYVRHCRLYRS